MTITIFCYGTLKRGQWNHDRFCGNAIDIRPATIIGRLYQLPAGYPAVVIPEESILAHGTDDPLADARTQAELAARGVTVPEVQGDWDAVHGELMTFADPARDLPPLDRFEGFRPDGHGLYRRALVAARSDTSLEPVWVYQMRNIGTGKRLRDGRWPSRRWPGPLQGCGDQSGRGHCQTLPARRPVELLPPGRRPR